VVTQNERSHTTRRALLDAARSLFAERGYADVSVGEIAERAGVTTGAIYHHFASKKGLFSAVYEELVRATWVRIETSREQAAGPGVVADCEAYLDACADPAFFRITADGPAVIGWDDLIDGTSRMIEASLSSARERGEIEDAPIAPVARMLAAALKEAGVMIATAENPAQAREEASAGAQRLISGLLGTRRAAGPVSPATES
jgi:AcrR family transcriptional regulator